MEAIEHIIHNLIYAGSLLLECAGVCVLLISAAKCIVSLIKHDPNVRLSLANGIALALEFKMGGEVLRTAIVREWNDLAVLGAIVVLRAAMTLLIHWEIESEEAKLGLHVKKKKVKHKKSEHSTESDFEDDGDDLAGGEVLG